jgi:hypothetical protein
MPEADRAWRVLPHGGIPPAAAKPVSSPHTYSPLAACFSGARRRESGGDGRTGLTPRPLAPGQRLPFL